MTIKLENCVVLVFKIHPRGGSPHQTCNKSKTNTTLQNTGTSVWIVQRPGGSADAVGV